MVQHIDFETFRRRQRGEETPAASPQRNDVEGLPESPRRRRRKKLKSQPRNEQPFYKKRGTYAWAAGLIVGFLLLLALAPISFGSVEVEGLQVLSRDEVFRVARIERPINVVQLATADISRRLNGDLRIASAKVEREFPATIRIQIEERRPIAVVATEFGFAVFDKTGLVIAEGPTITQTDVPFITGKKLGNVLLGDTVTDDALRKALGYLSHLSRKGGEQISEINIGDAAQLIAYTRDDIPIHLGAVENAAEQAPLSENMLKDIRLRNLAVDYVDANVGAPYIKLK